MKNQIQNLFKSLTTSAKIFIRTFGRVITPAQRMVPTSCVNINSLLMHLCDFDQFTYQYVIKWLAYPIQNPGTKMQHSIVVNGPAGTGSSMFFDTIMGALYGHQAAILSAARAFATFNPWALSARYVVLHEYAPGQKVGGRDPAAMLKAYITSDEIMVEKKGSEPLLIPNRMNFVFVSSSDEFLPLSSCSDRRFFVLEAPPKRAPLFYQAVAAEVANGGVDAFYKYLAEGVNLTGFNQFSEPPTFRTAHMPLEFA